MFIVLDDPTKEFLSSLRSLRLKSGKTLKEVGKAIKISGTAVGSYEKGTAIPLLRNLLSLAEYFGYDLSASVNYKYYHGQLTSASIRERMSKLGLTYSDLSGLTKYDEQSVYHSVHQTSKGTLLCLNAVLEAMSGLERR